MQLPQFFNSQVHIYYVRGRWKRLHDIVYCGRCDLKSTMEGVIEEIFF